MVVYMTAMFINIWERFYCKVTVKTVCIVWEGDFHSYMNIDLLVEYFLMNQYVTQGIVVDKEFRAMKEELQATRDISIPHGMVLSDYTIVTRKKPGTANMLTYIYLLLLIISLLLLHSSTELTCLFIIFLYWNIPFFSRNVHITKHEKNKTSISRIIQLITYL